MRLKTCQFVCRILYAVGVILGLAAILLSGWLRLVLAGLALACVVAYVAIRSTFWRCPVCHAMLGKFSPTCPHCGNVLEQ